MNRLPRIPLLALLLLFVALTISLPALTLARQPAAPQGEALNLSLQTVVPPNNLSAPVEITHAGDDRLFVVERAGRIRIVRPNGSLEPTPFLDIEERVRLQSGTEQGLLGLAFHPDFAANGHFYVNYTAEPDGATHIARFTVSADADVADPDSELLILEVNQPYNNHNGGDLLFGPDGYLYIPLGDGGSGNDPQNRAQNMQTLLGKLLRIDVDANEGASPDCGAGDAYTIPADNPFNDGAGGDCDEIWALGLRNPWRAGFDRLTGDLYIGDVGQGDWEEIDFQPAGEGGANYGWPCYEGSHEHLTDRPFCEDLEASDLTMPIFDFAQNANSACAVTGGYVYRGHIFPQMQGRYIFADFCAPYLWDLENAPPDWLPTRHDNMQAQLSGIATFGENRYGEIYLANLFNGALYHLTEDTRLSVEDAAVLLPLATKP